MSSNIPIIFKWYLNRQGIQGSQGVQGEEGFSPTITVNEDTLTNYTLRVQNKNGSFITPNLRQTVQDSGGTYVRYERNSGKMFAGFADGATINQVGVVRLARPQEVIDGVEDAVITPANLIDYLTDTYQLPIATATVLGGIKVGENLTITEDGVLSATGGGSSNLNNITDTDSGVAITDADSGLTYPQTINITTANENENYSYIECKSSGSGSSSGIKFGLDNLTLMGGYLKGTTSGDSAGIKLSVKQSSTNPSMIISEPVLLKGRKDVHNVVSNLLAFDYTHTTGTSNNFSSNGFFIFNKQITYSGSFTTNGILFSVGDEPSIKFTTSTSDGGVWTDNVNATVLTDKTGIQYKALTSAEYTELQTKSDSTIYRLTDTNEVYLGAIPLTGGAGAQYKTLLINNYDNATQTNLGGSTTVQVTDTEV